MKNYEKVCLIIGIVSLLGYLVISTLLNNRLEAENQLLQETVITLKDNNGILKRDGKVMEARVKIIKEQLKICKTITLQPYPFSPEDDLPKVSSK